MPWIDPAKEATAWLSLVQAGFCQRGRSAAQAGVNRVTHWTRSPPSATGQRQGPAAQQRLCQSKRLWRSRTKGRPNTDTRQQLTAGVNPHDRSNSPARASRRNSQRYGGAYAQMVVAVNADGSPIGGGGGGGSSVDRESWSSPPTNAKSHLRAHRSATPSHRRR